MKLAQHLYTCAGEWVCGLGLLCYFNCMNEGLSIFIIDDDLDDQVLMQQAFESTGVPVRIKFATRSDEALQYLSSAENGQRPDIIVSDYNMPMMNGEEFLKRLQEETPYRDVPKVIVSTAASPAIIEACISHGASRYLIKPSDFEELIKLANEIIALAKH
jgi:CheY-like chemotaxis protein